VARVIFVFARYRIIHFDFFRPVPRMLDQWRILCGRSGSHPHAEANAAIPSESSPTPLTAWYGMKSMKLHCILATGFQDGGRRRQAGM